MVRPGASTTSDVVRTRWEALIFDVELTNQGQDKIMNRSPLVSIIIPTHSRAKILTERALPSIFEQTYQNFEIIVVMDDCTDNTHELLKEINDPRLKIIDFKKGYEYPEDPLTKWHVAGSPPRNEGLLAVTGDMIAPLDDDDMFLPNHLDVAVKTHLATGCDVSYAIAETVRKSDNSRIGSLGAPPGQKMRVPHGSLVYNSKHRTFKYSEKGKLPADFILWNSMFKAGLKFEFINLITTRHWL